MRLLPYCRIIAIMWCTLLITTLLSYNRLDIQYTLLITTLLSYNRLAIQYTLLITTLLTYNRLVIQYNLLITILLTYNSYSMYPADYGVRQHLLAMKSNIPE